MRIVCISDTHSLHRQVEVPEGDVLVVAGDVTREGEIESVYDLAIWLAGLPHAHKVIIPGNHDFCFDVSHRRFDGWAKRMLEERRPNIHFLLDSARTLLGYRFYGSPWVPNLSGWAFYDRGRDMFRDAPTDVEVLVTHGPPWLARDSDDKGHFHYGSGALAAYSQRCPKLLLHVFGHVHEGYGKDVPGDGRGPILVNACSLNRAYECVNAPITVELPDRSTA